MAKKKDTAAYYHWCVEQTTADGLEVTLNTMQYDGYDIVKMMHVGEQDGAGDEVEDVVVVVGKTLIGSGAASKKELRAICDEDEDSEYRWADDDDEDDEDEEGEDD